MTALLRRCSAAALLCLAATIAVSPLQAQTTAGEWVVSSEKSFCSIGTKQNDAMLILMTSSSGASGIMLKPADQSLITTGTAYPLKVNLNNSPDIETTANAGDFGGVKVLHIKVNAAHIAAGETDGFAFRVSLNGKLLFDKDLHGSHDAFAQFVECSKKFGA